MAGLIWLLYVYIHSDYCASGYSPLLVAINNITVIVGHDFVVATITACQLYHATLQ